MTKKLDIRRALAGAVIATFVGGNVALAETEPNDTTATAQKLVIGSEGSVQVSGVINTLSGTVHDVDFYSFEGHADDVVTIDIDGGMDANCLVGVDTNLTLLGPDGSVVAQNIDNYGPLDAGSVCFEDALIANVKLPVNGTYFVAVTSFADIVLDAGTVVLGPLGANSDGPYTLLISGVKASTLAAQQVNIEVRPGSREVVPLNPNAKGTLPVALLSSSTFNALGVDRTSLKFGQTGTEDSLVRCNKEGADVNGDGLPDLLCHFDNQKANFQLGDVQGHITGTNAGRPFAGQGYLKVVAGKRHGR